MGAAGSRLERRHSQHDAAWDETVYDPSADGYRLPTEIEWEYAARGGFFLESFRYSGSNNIDEVAWYTGNSSEKTHEVKKKAPNRLGLYDMTGNVHEWCWSRSDNINTNIPGSSRKLRGGGWNSCDSYCTVFHWEYGRPYHRVWHTGFRVMRSSSN